MDLVAQKLDRVGARSDVDDAFLVARPPERRALRQHAESRVYRPYVVSRGDGQNRVGIQVAAFKLRRADARAVIGHAAMQAVRVGLGVYGHGFVSELTAGADDAYRDLSSVGD